MGWMLVGRAALTGVDGTDGWRQGMEALLPEDVSARAGWPDCGDVVVVVVFTGAFGRLDEIRQALAPMFVGAPAWLEANDVGVWPLQPAPRETVAEVLRVTIEHGEDDEDDLREWLTRSGYRATLDRRSVASVVEAERGCARGCEVGLQSGSLWLLDAPYAEVVAWWRGGR